jgi:broad specificity phosphatase PhoE
MARRIAALMRHADYQQLPDTPSALQPFALTENGIAQSKQAAVDLQAVLQLHNWQLASNIQTSSSLRAWQTAMILREELQHSLKQSQQLHSVDNLTERSVGSVANLTTKQIEQVVNDDPRFATLPANWKSDSHFKLPFIGAESLLEAGQRVADYLTEVMVQLPISSHDQVQLFIGHGASFRHAAYVLGVIDFAQVATLSMHHAKPIFIEYLNTGTWRQIAGDWKVRVKRSEYTD